MASPKRAEFQLGLSWRPHILIVQLQGLKCFCSSCSAFACTGGVTWRSFFIEIILLFPRTINFVGRFDKFPNQKMLQVFQVFNKLSEIQVKLKTKCMKTMGTHLDGQKKECSNPKRKIGQNCQTKNGLKWPFLGRFSKINPESCSTLLVLSYRSIKS